MPRVDARSATPAQREHLARAAGPGRTRPRGSRRHRRARHGAALPRVDPLRDRAARLPPGAAAVRRPSWSTSSGPRLRSRQGDDTARRGVDTQEACSQAQTRDAPRGRRTATSPSSPPGSTRPDRVGPPAPGRISDAPARGQRRAPSSECDQPPERSVWNCSPRYTAPLRARPRAARAARAASARIERAAPSSSTRCAKRAGARQARPIGPGPPVDLVAGSAPRSPAGPSAIAAPADRGGGRPARRRRAAIAATSSVATHLPGQRADRPVATSGAMTARRRRDPAEHDPRAEAPEQPVEPVQEDEAHRHDEQREQRRASRGRPSRPWRTAARSRSRGR